MSGNWSGIFESNDSGTQITFTEEIQVKKAIMNLFVNWYLKKSKQDLLPISKRQ